MVDFSVSPKYATCFPSGDIFTAAQSSGCVSAKGTAPPPEEETRPVHSPIFTKSACAAFGSGVAGVIIESGVAVAASTVTAAVLVLVEIRALVGVSVHTGVIL